MRKQMLTPQVRTHGPHSLSLLMCHNPCPGHKSLVLIPWVVTHSEGQGVRSMCEHMWCKYLFPHELSPIYTENTPLNVP